MRGSYLFCQAVRPATGVRASPPKTLAALRWLKSKIVVEVSFVEWTRDNLLRHPEFLAMRSDKRPREVIREN